MPLALKKQVFGMYVADNYSGQYSWEYSPPLAGADALAYITYFIGVIKGGKS